MRSFITSSFVLTTLFASAQYIPTSFEGPKSMKITQIDNHEYSTLVFFEYSVPEDSTWQLTNQWMNFSDKTFIAIPGFSKKYNLLSTVNVPIDSEAEHKRMLFDYAGQHHKFVLEFEKIPDDCTQFSIIESLDNPLAFNIRNIIFNPTDSFDYINIDDYIADYPLKEYGQYYVNGHVVTYVKFKGIIVNAVPNFVDKYGKYVCVNLSVQNFRNHSILFNPDNLSAIGYRHPKKKQLKRSKSKDGEDDIYIEHSVRKTKGDDDLDTSVTIPFEATILSYNEYDHIVRKKQNWESFWAALGEGLAAASAGYSSSTTTYTMNSYTSSYRFGSSYTTTYGQSHTSSYNVAQYAANQQAAAHMAELSYSQDRIRQQIGDGYVKMHTIPAETEYSGFFNVKYGKKMTGLSFTLVIDGESYTFYF